MDILDRGDNEKGLIIGARYLGLVVRSAVMDYPKCVYYRFPPKKKQ